MSVDGRMRVGPCWWVIAPVARRGQVIDVGGCAGSAARAGSRPDVEAECGLVVADGAEAGGECLVREPVEATAFVIGRVPWHVDEGRQREGGQAARYCLPGGVLDQPAADASSCVVGVHRDLIDVQTPVDDSRHEVRHRRIVGELASSLGGDPGKAYLTVSVQVFE